MCPITNPRMHPIMKPTMNPIMKRIRNPNMIPRMNPSMSSSMNPMLNPIMKPVLRVLCMHHDMNPIMNPCGCDLRGSFFLQQVAARLGTVGGGAITCSLQWTLPRGASWES